MNSLSIHVTIRDLLKGSLFFVCWSYLLLTPYGVVEGKTAGDAGWESVDTKHTIVCYQFAEDLKKFDKKVDYSPGEWGFSQLFSRFSLNRGAVNLKEKVDTLFERVQKILDMRKSVKKVTIRIYPNKKQLQAAYHNIYREKASLRAWKASHRAWYVYEHSTVYINADDVHEGMLAHEVAHHIIDNYFEVRAPRATTEILSRYVESRLFE
jgi:hypothetical protein